MSRIYEGVDSAYATRCSNITLCSNSKGFFLGFAEEVVALADPRWLTALEVFDDGKKLETVLENKEVKEAIKEVLSRIQPLRRGKCGKTSCERRSAAQLALDDGDVTKALALASQAVLRAPVTGENEQLDGGVTLALALWLRSEILLRCDRPRAALEDLKLALKERLPAKMRAKYYWRMGHCYRGAGEATRAKVSYELAGRLLGNDADAKAELQRDIDTLDFTLLPKHPPDKKAFLAAKVVDRYKWKKMGEAFAQQWDTIDLVLTGGAKQNMPSLSKLVKITEEENKGRFAVANSSIKTGDVLLVDSPYAACLLSDYYGSHCLHCFQRLEDQEDSAPVWCPKCSAVAFCSVHCRDIAVSTYHTYECPFLDLYIGSGMSILSHIALRMVTQAGLDTSLNIHSKHINNVTKSVEGTVINDIEGVSKKTKMKSRKERLNRAKKGLKNFADKNIKEEVEITEDSKIEDKMTLEDKLELKAAQIYSLCTHSELRKGEDYLKRVVMGMFLTECLVKGDFFKKCQKDNLVKAKTSICELIVRNLQLLQFNAHEIYETLRGEHQFNGSKPIYIAVGIYPVGALFNHECYPAVARYFSGRDIVLRATRPLAPGAVVSENYGPHFLTRSLRERQRSLLCRYWFQCQCAACEEDWPTLKQMKDDYVFLRCPNLSCGWKFRALPQLLPNRCAKCLTEIDPLLVKINVDTVERCLIEYQRSAELMEQCRADEASDTLIPAIDSFHEVARPPHKETHVAQEALRSCFAVNGNVHRVKDTPGTGQQIHTEQ